MKRRDIQADILSVISDGKIWTMKEIAEKVEVSYKTVYRHIHELSYRFNIQISCGGIQRGGVQLILERKVSVESLTNEDIDVIIITLSTVAKTNERITQFICMLAKFKKEELQAYNI